MMQAVISLVPKTWRGEQQDLVSRGAGGAASAAAGARGGSRDLRRRRGRIDVDQYITSSCPSKDREQRLCLSCEGRGDTHGAARRQIGKGTAGEKRSLLYPLEGAGPQ